MQLVKERQQFKNQQGEQITFTQCYLIVELNGVIKKIAIKAVFKNDASLLRLLSKENQTTNENNQ